MYLSCSPICFGQSDDQPLPTYTRVCLFTPFFLPMVEINVELKASSENLTKIQVLPTPLSPISSNLKRKSYVFAMMGRGKQVTVTAVHTNSLNYDLSSHTLPPPSWFQKGTPFFFFFCNRSLLSRQCVWNQTWKRSRLNTMTQVWILEGWRWLDIGRNVVAFPRFFTRFARQIQGHENKTEPTVLESRALRNIISGCGKDCTCTVLTFKWTLQKGNWRNSVGLKVYIHFFLSTISIYF